MLGRVLLAAALVLAAAARGDSAPRAPAAPAWSLHYDFGAVFGGGTTFDVDASGRYALIATTVRFPRSERSGTLAPAKLQMFAQLVSAANTPTWSDAYFSYRACIEHYPSLRLTRAREIAAVTVRVRWSCELSGLPADLRALILALRAQIAALMPDALTDARYRVETLPLARHDALELVTGDRLRGVSIAADGTITGRHRAGAALYPIADCPVRTLGTVDAATLAKLHALETPTAEVFYGTTRETHEVFEQAMADCSFPAGYGYAAPEYAVPPGTRWILQATRVDNSYVVTLAVDDAGRWLTRHKDEEPARGTIGGETLRALDRLVMNARDARWPTRFDGSLACEQILQITHVAPDGTRTNGPSIDGPCDGVGAPADAAALIRYVGERVMPELTRPR